MNQYRKLNNLIGWMVFAIATAVYFLTIEPTVSWWDPGEHIATAYKLQIGHPPGAPTYQLIGRIFALFAFGNTAKVALLINSMLSLSSSFTILFLFWTITMLARKLIVKNGEMTKAQMWGILAAAFVGSMAFTFSDSFWFSAVEANVFGMSYLFTAIVFWAILKWDEVADEKHSYRWLIFIGFMIGLSIGVHLLNLLTIPALTLVFYFRRFKVSRRGTIIALLISFVITGLIMYILIPWIPKMASQFELLFVNGFGLPFNSGTIFYFLLLTGLIIWGIIYTRKKGKTVLNTALLALVFLLIGYSSFIGLVIRANAGTPINENAPKDAISLVSFLNREQYGTWPFLYGQYYTAPMVDMADGLPVYKQDTASGKYVVIDDRKSSIPVYDSRFTTLFPRMWSTNRPKTGDFYKEYGGPGVPVSTTGPDGSPQTIYKPTFAENLKFFFTYQVNWMYVRYLMWNFSGRQNDTQGMEPNDIRNGNWITGIPFLDKFRLGYSMSDIPDNLKSRATNKYYMLPFLLGLAGLFFQFKNDYKRGLVIGFLFLMTGLAIVTYLNQQPFEPRERDYSYAGSFYAFSIWIGLGVLYLIDLIHRKLKMKEMMAVAIVALVASLLVPGIMAQQNWDDHDRSGKYATRDFAANYLNSCDKDAILFTNGDNDTFPLWYDQEVEGNRTDVRIVNLELASGSWYIDQMFNKAYDSDPLPFTLARDQYQPGSNDEVAFYDTGIKGYTELSDLIGFIRSEDPATYKTTQSGIRLKIFPTKNIKITVDKDACIKNGIVPAYLKDQIVDSIFWSIKKNYLTKNDIMMLDIIATNKWKRPVCFTAASSVRDYFNVDTFCLTSGWVYKFMPVKAHQEDYIPSMGGVEPFGSYDIIMNRSAWGNVNDPHVYIDPETRNNAYRPKTNILRVAQSLIRLNEKKKANDLMDLYFKYFPVEKFGFDMDDAIFANLYYRIGEEKKANKLIEMMGKVYSDNLAFYSSFSGRFEDAWKSDIQNSLELLNSLKMLATQNKQDKLAKKMEELFNRSAGKLK
ncbi:MAG: DUF2723 domain-containing protein [Bacteroidetes bacterium]|nr:DUF2723 domain-containing protein [Bacteroidota bacterium]